MSIKYFSHDVDAWSDNKIAMMRVKYGNEGYGLYWLLVEMLYVIPEHKYQISSELAWEGLKIRFNSKINVEQFVSDCCNLFHDGTNGLFERDENFFWSNEVLRRSNKIKDVSEKRKEAINKRWSKHSDTNVLQKKYNCNTSVIQTDTNVIQNDTNININKNKKENKNIINNILTKEKETSTEIIKATPSLSNQDLTRVVEYFNLKCDKLPKVIRLTETRKTKLKNRIKEFGIDGINALFNKVAESNFLNGESGWKASFDWILDSETRVIKILEGQYDNKQKPNFLDVNKRMYEKFKKEEEENDQIRNDEVIDLDKCFLS